jgi:hypothetical protein
MAVVWLPVHSNFHTIICHTKIQRGGAIVAVDDGDKRGQVAMLVHECGFHQVALQYRKSALASPHENTKREDTPNSYHSISCVLLYVMFQ